MKTTQKKSIRLRRPPANPSKPIAAPQQISTIENWSAAVAHLSATDPIIARLIDQVGPCLIRPRRDYFPALCKAIFSQQISTRIAAILFERFRALFPGRRPTPVAVLAAFKGAAAQTTVRACGLSRQKKLYLIDLARHFADGRIPTRRLNRMNDDQVIESLTAVHGIGRWTAEMFLMFVLNRPDVLPVDDLGLRQAVKVFYRLREMPDAARTRRIAKNWSPWRSVATWYLWRGLTLHQREKAANKNPAKPLRKSPTKRPASNMNPSLTQRRKAR
jgi:DNA-3-methyladenine glycosylase II